MAQINFTNWLRHPATTGAGWTALAGLIFWLLPLGAGLERLSYDLLTVCGSQRDFPELVLIELDESSHDELKQNRSRPWDRRLHAQLVRHLTEQGARLIVFDVELYEQVDDPASTAALAEAFRAHGNIVLAAHLELAGKPGYSVTIARRPVPELLVPGTHWALSWNISAQRGEEDGIVRLHPVGRDPETSVPWTAAGAAHAAVTTSGARHNDERWVRHYGPFGTLRHVSYWQATNEAAGFYNGRTVFIGGRPGTGFPGQEGDQFRTPWSRWHGSMVSGLELTATAWLNLLRQDWLVRAPAWPEGLALLLFGALLGAGLPLVSARRGLILSALGIVCVTAVALWLFREQNIWCDWTVPVLVQTPLALGWAALARHRALRREKEWLEAPLDGLFADVSSQSDPPLPAGDSRPSASLPGASGNFNEAPPIPEYDLLRCVGRGAYGEVWLARDALGGFRAIKIIRRIAFDDDGPYEREFGGLQRFAPISREHPGLVQILHVGVNQPGGYFYYVMEAGDDEQTGGAIDPARYVPRNLGRDLRLHRAFTAIDTAQLGVALADALEFLHQRALIHRDIKPANVIFVQGTPKLADIGLVTDLSQHARSATQVGTEGYIPPEGAGTIGGDIFALGRLLGESLGPASVPEDAAESALREILRQASAEHVAERLPTAAAVGAALRAWQNKYLPPPPPQGSMLP